MVDHHQFKQNVPGLFGSRNVAHEFSDEESNDEEIEDADSNEGGRNKIAAIDDTPVDQTGEKLVRYAKFKNYQSVFDNLTKYQKVPTKYDIVNMIITYDSTHAVGITKKDDTEYFVRFFNLETY